MKAEIISIGTEIILGSTLNTNTYYLTEKLTDAGIDVLFHTSVGDDSKILKDVINIGLDRTDLLIVTGGLGPTMDDITKEIVSETLGLEIELDNLMVNNIKKYFDESEESMPENNIKQAYKPIGSKFLINEIGTAPGIYIEWKGKTLILLPGPPKEMKLMFEKYVLPLINQDFIIKTKTINTIGIGESQLEIILKNIIEEKENPIIATYAKEGQIDIKIVAKDKNEEKIDILLNETVEQINNSIKEYIYSCEDETIEEVLFKKLKKENMKIAFCESCTGGLISSQFTKIPGASEVFDRGIVTYSNNSKMDELKVKKDTLSKYGAVSKETATEMATGILNKTGVDIALSTTGVAGPDGGTVSKPVGLVYIGIATKDNCFVIKCLFKGNRQSIQNKATKKAFSKLIKTIE